MAFSGATEFMEKFKEANDANEIIGRFGLGFYSSFMVVEKVEIQTLSYQEVAEAPVVYGASKGYKNTVIKQ